MRIARYTVLTLALLACAATAAPFVESEHVRADWVSEGQSIQPGTPFALGLRIRHRPHWHTYWPNPGEFGYATTVEWDLPEGFVAGEIQWPYPEWIRSQGLTIFAYAGEVMAVVEITPPATLDPGAAVQIGGTLSWLECEDTCIPGGGEMSITLPVSAEPPALNPDAVEAFAQARKRLPVALADWTATYAVAGNDMLVHLQPPSADLPIPDSLTYFPRPEGLFNLSNAFDIVVAADGVHITGRLNPAHEDIPPVVNGLLVADGGVWPTTGSPRAIAFEAVAIGPGGGPGPAAGTGRGLFLVIIGAFVGGLILNLMPCVFPVISLKILGFVNIAQEDPQKVWRHGLVFAAGVMVSFWALAALLLVLKSSFPSIGWGFQLAEPLVVIGMTALFFLLALNLFGVFELGTSLTGVGAAAQARQTWLGTFLSGVLATVVATPCTAPFMGAAVGVALTQPAAIAMAIFTSLGLGMAMPYLLLSRFPAWLKLIPRPGPWMESLKQFLGFLMMGFACYLIWILADLRGTEGLSRLLVGLLVLGLGAWIHGRWGAISRGRPTRIAAAMTSLGLLLGGLAVAVSSPPESPWIDYSPELVAGLRGKGKPVFVDFTASWCLTCQANKKLTLNTQTVQDRFHELGVTLVKADWTRQQEPITSALAAFGRSGVPLYLLYGRDPEAPPTILPEILTPGIVLDALESLAQE